MKKSQFKIASLFSVAVLALAWAVHAAEWKTVSVNVPTAIASITNTTLRSTASTAFDLPQNVPFVIMVQSSATQSTNTDLLVFGFDLTMDGTNWTTTAPLRMTNTANGTSTVATATQITATQLGGYKQARFGYLSTVTGTAMAVGRIDVGYFY